MDLDLSCILEKKRSVSVEVIQAVTKYVWLQVLRALQLKARSEDQQHGHHLGAWQTCRISGPNLDAQNWNLQHNNICIKVWGMSFFPLSRQTHAYAVRGTRVHQPLRSRWPILEATKYVIYLVIRSRTGCYMEQRPHRERAVECRKKCLTVRIQVERPLRVWRKIVENPHPKGKLLF